MLGIILIFGSFIAALLAHILLKKKIRVTSPPFLYRILFSLFTLGGLVFIIWQQNMISAEFARHSWPTAEAKVIATKINGERAYNPELVCRYHVDGTDYLLTTDLNTPPFGRKRARRQTAEIIIGEYPVGSKILVHFNPEHPEQAYIRTGPFWNNYTILMLGLILFASGVFGLLSIRFGSHAPVPFSGS